MSVAEHLTRQVDAARERLVALSHAVHGDAELAFEEHTSADRVADALDGDFDVDHGVAGLDTAFVAEAGSGPLTVAIAAEYDALPSIGHACGHNIIAAAAVGAGRALAEVADELGITVRVVGTPAEEGGGGKIHLLEHGVFSDVHAAMMIHPAPYEATGMPCLARQKLQVSYRGRAAHASGYPHLGINAADAFTVAQVSIGLLRQHITGSDRIHGILTHGGDAPNVIPDRAEGTWYVRAPDLDRLAELEPRVERCFQAGALATGADLEIERPSAPYSQFEDDVQLAALYRHEAEAVGRRFDPPAAAARFSGSTDMANVSLEVPTIHPMVAIESDGAVNHQPEFAGACVRSSADRAVRDGALSMARTVAAAATDEDIRTRLLAGTRVLGG
jgi:amidohydrolase